MKTKPPLITIITPTYNRAKYIKETIESILSQNLTDFEYLILDDGSTDNTKELIRPYLKDKRVKYFFHKNAGEPDTVNRGWNLSKGKYFVQVNSDDPILPGLFTEMVNVMENNVDVVVAYPDFHFSDKDGRIIGNTYNKDWIFLEALSKFACYSAAPGTFIRKGAFSTWKNIRSSHYKYINDVEMYWKMALVGNFYHVPKFLATWRKHSEGISTDRYKSIPEVEDWYKNYFHSPNLPREVLACKQKTKESMYKYFLDLISESCFPESKKLINKYRKLLGLHKFKFNNLQVSDFDVVGNKFNGHDLHYLLRKNDVNSHQLVWTKESDDPYTHKIADKKYDREELRKIVLDIQKQYGLNGVFNPLTYDILFDKFFLETDIVHYHLLHNLYFDIQLFPILTMLKPTVWTLHDPWALGGHCVHHFDCKKWQKHCKDCPYLNTLFPLEKDNSALNFEIKKRAVQNSQIDIIVASQWMLKQVRQSPIFKGKRVHLVPFGIDHTIFKPTDKKAAKKILNIPEDAFVISFRCNYSEYKGMDYIEYVLKNISIKQQLFVLILGDKIQTQPKEHTYIHYGWIRDDKKLAAIYSASDLFLAPSKAETFGMMAVEAMSCGTLPIVTENTSLPEIVGSPKCGVSTVRDKTAYLRTVEYYINNSGVRNSRAKSCNEFALQRYSLDTYIKKIVRIYQQVIRRHQKTISSDLILQQLMKNQSQLAIDSASPGNYSGIESLTQTERYIVLYFYKIDKIVPKKIRRSIKQLLIKLLFLKKIDI